VLRLRRYDYERKYIENRRLWRCWSVTGKLSRSRGRPPGTMVVARIDRPVNALQLWVVTQRKFVAVFFFKWSAILRGKRPFCVLSPLWGLRGNAQCSPYRLIGKRVVDFVLLLTGLFSLDVSAEVLRANIDWKSAFLLQQGKFDQRAVVFHQPFFFSEN